MRILIVDHDLEMRLLLGRLLEADGYEIVAAGNSADALALATKGDLDLVLLDVVLGEEDGRDLLLELRLTGDLPAIFLTARGLERDRINGLRMGADDYIVKPFSTGELSARIEAVLRRSRPTETPHGGRDTVSGMRFGNLRIELLTREVECSGELVELTTKEFNLLSFLASSPRQVFSRQQLLEQVWESSKEWQGEATVTEHIHRVRQKIERDPRRPHWVTTVRGVGYRFDPHADRRLSELQVVPDLAQAS